MKKQHNLYLNDLVGDIRTNPHGFYWQTNGHKKDTGVTETVAEQAELNSQFMDVVNKN